MSGYKYIFIKILYFFSTHAIIFSIQINSNVAYLIQPLLTAVSHLMNLSNIEIVDPISGTIQKHGCVIFNALISNTGKHNYYLIKFNSFPCNSSFSIDFYQKQKRYHIVPLTQFLSLLVDSVEYRIVAFSVTKEIFTNF